MSIRLVFVSFLVSLAAFAAAAERQHHGMVFETWVQDTFFDGYRPAGYTQNWDIPAEANTRFGGIPVNPKAARFRGPVDLGDALRQFDIDEPFWLVVGFWDGAESARRMVKIVALRIEPEAWRTIWGSVTRRDLEELDALIKDRSLTPDEARAAAQAIKARPVFRDAAITVNPKIDSRTQRRLQCSLRYEALFAFLAPPGTDRGAEEKPALWGAPWPGF